MDLLIDIGNSRVKWAELDAGSLHGIGAIEHRSTVDATNAVLDNIAAMPTRVIAANVAGERLGTLFAGAVHERWGLPVRFAVTQQQAGPVRNGYDDFRKLGVDRWLAIIAAVNQFAGALCIVDAGTAVTIDVVAADGAHLGGYIIPGLDLMRESLGEETGDLRRLVDDEQQLKQDGLPPFDMSTLGRSTTEAISGGTLAAVCCLIDRCVSILSERQGDSTLVVTGGGAEPLIPHLGEAAHHREQLVLEGLTVYEFDEPSASMESGCCET